MNMAPPKLTDRQAEILEFIAQYVALHGFSPSVRDVATAFNMTPNGAYGHIKPLEKKGYLVHERGLARTYRILSVQPES